MSSSAVETVNGTREKDEISSSVVKLDISGAPNQDDDNQQAKGDAESRTEITPPKKRPEDFRFGKLLGEGSFSSVYLAKDVKSGIEFAIKVCNKQHIIRERKSDSVRREKDTMTILSANRNPRVPFFVRLYATFQDPERLYFVMTFGRGGELLKYLQKLKTFNKELCQFYIGEIVLALAHLHNLSIVHRDMKPENILLDEAGHILITDYGSAKILKGEPEKPKINPEVENADESHPLRITRNNSFVGTAQYVSPEVLHGKYSEVGPPADLWALGCILFQFATGASPFNGPNEYLVFQKIIAVNYECPADFDPATRDLIDSLLKEEPLQRIGAKDTDRYKSIQAHIFFEGISFDTLSSQTPPMSLICSSSELEPLTELHIPDTVEPGFDPRVIAKRVLQDEGLDLSDVNVMTSDTTQTNADITNMENKAEIDIKKTDPEFLYNLRARKIETQKSCCAYI